MTVALEEPSVWLCTPNRNSYDNIGDVQCIEYQKMAFKIGFHYVKMLIMGC